MNLADNEQNPLSLCVHSDPASRAVFASNSLPIKNRPGFFIFFYFLVFVFAFFLMWTTECNVCSLFFSNCSQHPFPWT